MAKKPLLERLSEGIVLGAEGYLFELERRGYVKAGAYVPEITLENPQVVRQLHRDFLRAGAEVMVAFTYYAHRNKMRAIGKEAVIEPLNRAAVRLAKEVAAEGDDVLVAANLSNTWEYDPNDPATEAVVREMFREQLRWATDEGGIDLVIAETFDHAIEARIAAEVIKEFDLPAVVTFAAMQADSLDGYPWPDACVMVEAAGADVVGLNCARGPLTMLPLLEKIRAKVKGHMAAQPVAYRTDEKAPYFQLLRFENGHRAFPIELDPFTTTRYEMAEFARKARDLGVNYIGICCGGAPHHVRAMAEALGRTTPGSAMSPDIGGHPVIGTNADQTAHGSKHQAIWEVDKDQ